MNRNIEYVYTEVWYYNHIWFFDFNYININPYDLNMSKKKINKVKNTPKVKKVKKAKKVKKTQQI